MPPQPHPLLKALSAIRGSGRFCATGSRPFSLLGLRIEGEEELAFPLPKSQAETIKRHAEPAPYGKGEATRYDPAVRKCWQVDASGLEWVQPDWDDLLADIVSSVTGDLGVEGKVVADPYKLLLYERGGFFLPHRDTEKLDKMFGTLIVALPSEHKGGELVVRHGGEEVVVDFSSPKGSRKIQFAAFFADCEHEVKPVESGHRLCLAFNLVLKKGKASKLNLPASAQAAALVPYLRKLADADDPDVTAVLLEHQYSPANLSVATLKNHDRVRAQALFAAADEAGLVAYLALVTLHQSGELESDDGYGWGDDIDPEDAEMGEVYDESLSIDLWRTPADKAVDLGPFAIDESRLVSDAPLASGDPDQREAEGFTGNAGCTMDYWYFHAAVVLWAKDADARVRVRYGFHKACDRLLAMAKRPGAAQDKEFRDLARAATAEADRLFQSEPEGFYGDYASDALPLVEAVAKAGWREAFDGSSPGLLPWVLAEADAKQWRAVLATFGSEPAEAVFGNLTPGEWTVEDATAFSALDAMLASKEPPAIAATIAAQLPALLETSDEQRFLDDDPDTADAAQRHHLAIAASHLVADEMTRNRILTKLRGRNPLSRLRHSLGAALLSRRHKHHLNQPGSLFPELLRSSIELLEQEVARPINPFPDWKRPFPERDAEEASEFPWALSRSWGLKGDTKEALDAELKAFLADPTAESHRFIHAQEKRGYLESVIRERGLDLDYTTLMKGSPYSLVCTKNDKSYHRALTQRASDEKLLAALNKLAPSSKRRRH